MFKENDSKNLSVLKSDHTAKVTATSDVSVTKKQVTIDTKRQNTLNKNTLSSSGTLQ